MNHKFYSFASLTGIFLRLGASLLLAALAFALVVPPAQVYAASFIVNSLDDNTTSGDSLCTLREAVESANNAGNGDCGPNSSADDTVTFSVSGGITLGSTLDIGDASSYQGALTIDGGGVITVSGNNSVRVFKMIDAPGFGADLSLQNLTVADGYADGVDGYGGGGVFNPTGTLNVTNSTFSNNASALGGGGIHNEAGTVNLTDSTFSGNSAPLGAGGGVYSLAGALNVSNSTFSGNSADSAGGIHNESTLNVSNSTFSSNSANTTGGIHNTGSATLNNTIIANNTSGGDCDGYFQPTSANNITTDANCGASNTPAVFTQVTGTQLNLGPLADNGGPTQTMALIWPSAAIDAGDVSSLTADQRGLARPFNSTVDIGAYEATIDMSPTTLADGNLNAAYASVTLAGSNGTAPYDFALTDGTLPNGMTLSSAGELSGTPTEIGDFTFVISATDANGFAGSRSYTLSIINPPTTASITIIKDATPSDGTNFTFLTTIPLHSLFFLDDAAVDDNDGISNSSTFLVNPGNYTIIESTLSGWNLTNINCVSSDPNTGMTVVNNVAFVVASAGEIITCTYTNVKRGTITVVKDAVEANGTDFTINLGGDATATATVDDAVPDDSDGVDADFTFSLLPGSYTLSETIPSAWNLNDLQCSTDDTSQAVTVTTNLAEIELDAGENVTCTFTNERKKATITVIKDALPADGTNFTFLTTISSHSLFFLDDAAVDDNDGISDTFTVQVFPGSYTVLESVPGGWVLTDLDCVTSDPSSGITVVNNVAFFVAAGDETITCTFTNVKRGTITVVKDADPADGTNFTINLGGDATNTAVLDDAVPDDGDGIDTDSTFSLLPGNYTLSETILSGWNLQDIECVTSDTGEPVVITTNLASIDLDAGENVTCTFTNEALPPTVTINQSGGSQSDPTGINPIEFTVIFSEAVTDFDDAADVTLTGTASATVTGISGSGANYTVQVTATSDGTIIANILAGVAVDVSSLPNDASTSTDNTVTYDGTIPSVTINQASSQADPTSNSPVNFTAVFSEAVTDFDDTADVTLSGTAGATTVSITQIAPNNGTAYNVAVSGMTSGGTVIANIPSNAAQDLAANGNAASTSTDNTVIFTVNTITTITSDTPDPSTVGQTITVNFSVVAAVGTNPLIGTITVADNGNPSPSCTAILVTAGTCNVTLNSTGTHTLTATYSGDTGFNSSNDAETHSVSVTIATNTANDDLTPSNGTCSLREAIRAANLNVAVDACPAGSATIEDRITVGTGTYTLTRSGIDDTAVNGDLDIIGDTLIVGNGSTFISGGSLDRVFHILSGTVQIANLTIKNGSNPIGGGIYNAGTLIMNSVTVTANVSTTGANGISHGAGIYNTGTLTLTLSTVSSNTATSGFTGRSRGAGIHNNGGILTINNSTVTANKAISGINGISQGGGIYTTVGSTTLNSTTPSGNTVTAGAGGSAQGPNTYP